MPALHFFGGFNSKELKCGHELDFHQAAELQEKNFLGLIGFREDVVMMVEKVERLGELEGVFGDERGFLGCDGGVDLRVERSGQEGEFPEGVAVFAGE
jgi:hypothetical protein